MKLGTAECSLAELVKDPMIGLVMRVEVRVSRSRLPTSEAARC